MTDQNDALGENSATTGAPVRGGTPSGDDPFVAGAPREPDGTDVPDPIGRKDPTGEDGPSYERAENGQNQVRHDDRTGGSTDPHNTLGHADSGDESE